MSKIKISTNIAHLPSFKEYRISAQELVQKYSDLGVEIPFPVSDSWYYHTDRVGWAKIVPDLLIKSSLYKQDRFDCEDMALKAQTTCTERNGLNTLRYTYGSMSLGFHGFNTLWTGDAFLIFEPNSGYQLESPLFEIGMFGYLPQKVLL